MQIKGWELLWITNNEIIGLLNDSFKADYASGWGRLAKKPNSEDLPGGDTRGLG